MAVSSRPKNRAHMPVARAPPACTSGWSRANRPGRTLDSGRRAQKRRTRSSLKMLYPASSSSAPSPVSTTFMPASRTRPDSRYSGTGAVRSSGASQCHTTSASAPAISSGPHTISWWPVPSRRAMRRCSAVSSKAGSAKRTANVSSGAASTWRTSDAITDESRPPLR